MPELTETFWQACSDPANFLRQRDWSENEHDDGVMWGHEADDVSVLICGDSTMQFFGQHTTIAAADVYALTLLAIGAHDEADVKPVVSLANVDDRHLWKEIVRQSISNGMSMAQAIADADMFIDALRKRGA